MYFDINVTEQDGWAVVTVTGEVDVATAPRLREEIVRLGSDGSTQLAIDLEAVDFLDSMGLGVLVGALKRVRTHQGELVVVCTNDRILRIFGITGLDRVFDIRDTVAAATGGAQKE